jgi:hypothetical protein
LAADQIAGAGTIAPATAPVTDLRKSRRFMGDAPNARGKRALERSSQGLCQPLRKALSRDNRLILLANMIDPGVGRGATTLTNCIQRDIFAQ